MDRSTASLGDTIGWSVDYYFGEENQGKYMDTVLPIVFGSDNCRDIRIPLKIDPQKRF